MGPRSNPDFSTDGQKTTLIPLVEWLQRKLEEISLTNSDAASFRALMQHGTLSVKGYSTVISPQHASVLIRRSRTSEPGTLATPVPWCFVANPATAAPGDFFDVDGAPTNEARPQRSRTRPMPRPVRPPHLAYRTVRRTAARRGPTFTCYYLLQT